MEASSGNTVNPVLDPAVFPAMATGSVWTEPMELDFVSVTKVSTEPPVKRVRTASLESTVIKVGGSTVPQDVPPPHLSLWEQTAAAGTAAAATVLPETEPASVTSAGEECCATTVGPPPLQQGAPASS